MMQSYMSIVAVVIAFLETSKVTFHCIVVAYELQYLNSRLEKNDCGIIALVYKMTAPAYRMTVL
jgi:hypothetical protein